MGRTKETTTLSKRWVHIWKSVTHLNFDSYKFHTMPQFMRFVNNVLSKRNSSSQVSAVELRFKGPATESVIERIVNYAYLHSVEKLSFIWFTYKEQNFPPYLFTCDTLKHLTLAVYNRNMVAGICHLPKLPWDFPALETLNLRDVRFHECEDKSANLFSKCMNLKELTLHGFAMPPLETFNICAPQLSSLTIGNAYYFPKVLNVVAPQLKYLTASIQSSLQIQHGDYLQLSTVRFNSLEKVMPTKVLILDMNIIQILSSCKDYLLLDPEVSPFNNLTCLRVDATHMKAMEGVPLIDIRVRNYFLRNSSDSTFIMDSPPQVPQKRVQQQVHNQPTAKKRTKAEGKDSKARWSYCRAEVQNRNSRGSKGGLILKLSPYKKQKGRSTLTMMPSAALDFFVAFRITLVKYSSFTAWEQYSTVSRFQNLPDTCASMGLKKLNKMSVKHAKHSCSVLLFLLRSRSQSRSRASLIYDNWSSIGVLQSFITHRDLYNVRWKDDIVLKDAVVDGVCQWPAIWIDKYPQLNSLNSIALGNLDDELVWRSKKGKEGKFTVKQAYNDLRSQNDEVSWGRLVWFSQNIPKHAFVLWMAIQNKLTKDKIKRWGSFNMMVCPLYYQDEDSHQHLFFQCSYTGEFWRNVMLKLNVHIGIGDWNMIINHMTGLYCGNYHKCYQKIGACCLCLSNMARKKFENFQR
nr:hypothetical protein [Tanacetum cinerariifolium]